MNVTILRRHGLPVVLLLAISIVACFKLFTGPFYTSHDGEGHVIRMIEFHEAMVDGQVPVRLAKGINYGLGYPFFNFNYPLVYYLGETFHATGLSYVDSFKSLLILSVLLGAFSMYAFMLSHTGRIGASISAVVFTIAPYKFLNIYVRANPAESLGLALLPLLLLSINRLIYSKPKAVFLCAITHSLLLLSHNITAVIGFVFGFLYLLYQIHSMRQKCESIIKYLKGMCITLLLTAFFWVPVVAETHLTRLVELSEDYRNFFPTITEIIYSPWGFGGYKQGAFPGKMSPQIGLVHFALLIFSVLCLFWYWIRKRKNDTKVSLLAFFTLSSIIFLFFALPNSRFIWDRVTLLQFVQIPWRFVGFIILCVAVTTGIIITKILSKKLLFLSSFLLIVLLLYSNRNHIRVNQYISFQNPFEISEIYGPSTTSKDEHMPRWAPRIYEPPIANGEVFPADIGTSVRTLWKSNDHVFALVMNGSGDFRDNTSFFPGWHAYVDGAETPIIYQDDPMGRLRVQLKAGKHTIEFKFGETWYRMLADLVSVISFVIGVTIILRAIRQPAERREVLDSPDVRRDRSNNI